MQTQAVTAAPLAMPDEQVQRALFAAKPFVDAWERSRDKRMSLDHGKALLLAHYKGGRSLSEQEHDKAWDLIREHVGKECEQMRRSMRLSCRTAADGHDIEDQDGHHGKCRVCRTWFLRSDEGRWLATDGDPRGVTFELTSEWAARAKRTGLIEMILIEATALLLAHYTEGLPVQDDALDLAWQLMHDDLRKPFESLHRELSRPPY